MQGVLNLYKEKGYTSFHAVAVLRKLTGENKIGHTGTLDPDASGVLPLCFGKATKLVDRLTDTDKTYRAVLGFGRRTDTQDISGSTLEEMPAEVISSKINESLVLEAFEHFKGEIEQIPPMYSAVKVGGVKLVDAARRGRVIKRNPRKVTVYGYSDIEISMDRLEVSFTVDCSKGTYIRTLCEDIGAFLNVPACLKELERTRAAGLGKETAITLDQVKSLIENGTLSDYLIPTDRFLLEYPYLIVKDDAVKRLIYGNYLYRDDFFDCMNETPGGEAGRFGSEGVFRIYDCSGQFYALYRYDSVDICCKCEKMFS